MSTTITTTAAKPIQTPRSDLPFPFVASLVGGVLGDAPAGAVWFLER